MKQWSPIKWRRLFFAAGLGVVLLVPYQNCAPQMQVQIAEEGAFSSSSPTTTQPNTPNLSFIEKSELGTFTQNCGMFDACVFWKNPVAHGQAPLTNVLTRGTDLSGLQKFGVDLDLAPGQTKLENSSFIVGASGWGFVLAENLGGDDNFDVAEVRSAVRLRQLTIPSNQRFVLDYRTENSRNRTGPISRTKLNL